MVGMSFNACKGDSESAVWKDMGARRERRRTIRKAPESLGRGRGGSGWHSCAVKMESN